MKKTKDVIKASYLPTKDAEKTLSKYGWKLDPELSRMDTKVFYDPKSKQAQVLHRGSKRFVEDWVETNIPLALGRKDTKRFQYAKDITQRAKEKYGDVYSWGHSLGGALALQTSNKSTVLNPAISPVDIGKTFMQSQQIVKKSLDPVSVLSGLTFGGNKEIQKSKTFSPFYEHSVESFDS